MIDLHILYAVRLPPSLLLPYVILARLEATETIRQAHPTVQMTLLHHRSPVSSFRFSLLRHLLQSAH